MFDGIYTGTETRHPAHTDQHLPRYLSYALMRYFENVAPGHNGGGWFDAFECYPIDAFLEQCYLTAFSKPRELMMFCWPLLYKNKLSTALGFQIKEIEAVLNHLGNPVGVPVYIPYNAQGEDHLEDYLGMIGIPFEPVPNFPLFSDKVRQVFLTVQALLNPDIIPMLHDFLNAGGKALVSSGFMIKALAENRGIEALTSIRYRGRRLSANEYHVSRTVGQGMVHRYSGETVDFPLLEHRNNASWSLINAGSGDFHGSLLLRDTVGRGELFTVVVPDQYSALKQMPQDVLTRMRSVFSAGIYLALPPQTHAQVSLFTYDNSTFGLYSYTADGCAPEWVQVHITGVIASLQPLPPETVPSRSFSGKPVEPLYTRDGETIFELYTEPGRFSFYQWIEKDT
jgi:hypothetical protein